MKQSSPKKVFFLIALGGAVLFIGLYLLRLTGSHISDTESKKQVKEKIGFFKLTESDHVLGSKNADIFLIEYADVNCPFCRRLHPKLKQLVKNESAGTKISWVYRHFPLAVSADRVDPEEKALECAAVQGGDSTFFAYLEKIIAIAVGRENLIVKQLTQTAGEINLNMNLFNNCLANTTYDNRIFRDHWVGSAVGVSTVPHTFLLTREGVLEEVVGNKPLSVYEGIIKILEMSLSERK